MTGPSSGETCDRYGNLLFPRQLATGMQVPATADYVRVNCGRAYKWEGSPPTPAVVPARATEADEDGGQEDQHPIRVILRERLRTWLYRNGPDAHSIVLPPECIPCREGPLKILRDIHSDRVTEEQNHVIVSVVEPTVAALPPAEETFAPVAGTQPNPPRRRAPAAAKGVPGLDARVPSSASDSTYRR